MHTFSYKKLIFFYKLKDEKRTMKTVMGKGTKESYIYDMERIIRKNCLKYNGLNADADEFIPKTKSTIAQTTEKKGSTTKSVHKKSNDEEWFDQMEMEFVEQNVWIFE